MNDNNVERISPATKSLLILSMIKGVGPVLLRRAAIFFKTTNNYSIDELCNLDKKFNLLINDGDNLKLAIDRSNEQIAFSSEKDFRIISILDSDYPSLLSETKDDPCLLYIKGLLFSKPENSVAVIGTRQPTNHGKMITERVTKFFVENEWSIVSGLALGCDSIAHETALSLKGHTVAVLAHGLHTVAPARHKKLAERIVESGGALITEYPYGHDVQNQQYVKRDRIQSGLSKGVVMIQSDIKGGSLYASRASLEYGRWLAVPFPTKEDRNNSEHKIQANLLIANGSDYEKIDILKMRKEQLRNIIILNDKSDYFKLISKCNDESGVVEDMFGHNGIVEYPSADISNPIQTGLNQSSSEKGLHGHGQVFDLNYGTREFELKKSIAISLPFKFEMLKITNDKITKGFDETSREVLIVRLEQINSGLKSISAFGFNDIVDGVESIKRKVLVETVIYNIKKIIDMSFPEKESSKLSKKLTEQVDCIIDNFPRSVFFISENQTKHNDDSLSFIDFVTFFSKVMGCS